MSEIPLTLDPGPPVPPRRPRTRARKPRPDGIERERSQRRALVTSILVTSLVVHGILLLIFGIWTVAKHFSRPEARFEVKKTVRIPPRTPEHKMNVAKHEAMTPKPTFNDKLVSTRPSAFALPEMPKLELDQMLPLDPSELISDQVAGLVGSAALGSGLGQGLSGAGGTGKGVSFFGVRAEGRRVLLLFDVSASVVNKAKTAGVPLERIQEETLKLIDSLPIAAQFSLIQFTGNYLPFTEELIAATPSNKKVASQWVEDEWVKSGTMGASAKGVVTNLTGVVGVLERSSAMRPDVVFLISDASFQWRPDGGGGFRNIPYEDLKEAVGKLGESAGKRVPLHFVAFQPKADDAAEWERLVRKTGGEFRELKGEADGTGKKER